MKQFSAIYVQLVIWDIKKLRRGLGYFTPVPKSTTATFSRQTTAKQCKESKTTIN